MVALIAAFLVDRYVNGVKTAATAVPMTNEVVAVQDIPADTTIAPSMVRVRPVPTEYVTPGSATDAKTVVGAVAKSELYKGAPILVARIFHGQHNGDLPYLIPAGRRAITVKVDPLSGLSSMLKPGFYVDVLATLPTGRPAPNDTEVKTVLQNIKILAVDAVTGTVPRPPKTPPDEQTTIKYSTVTLLVTPAQAQDVALAAKHSLDLTLRPATDHTIETIPPVTVGAMR